VTPAGDPGAAAGGRREIPALLDSGEHALYSVLHTASASCPVVVVHCHSVGVEQLTLYRAEVDAARAVAAAGIPVLRFHARGHGDSTGDFADVTVSSLVEDALAAGRHARAATGAAGIVWLGVRLGALVAAHAARACAESVGLALWEPVAEPEAYFRGQLRALLFSEAAQGRRSGLSVESLLARLESEGAVDLRGYLLHRTLVASARGESLAKRLAGWERPTLLVQIQKRGTLGPELERLRVALEAQRTPLRVALVRDEPGWHFYTNLAWESAELAAVTRDWLVESFAGR
jgi:alpha/beta superfamily hydrolase